MEYNIETTAVIPGSHELSVSPGQVARYAGGTRYRIDVSLQAEVDTILETAFQLLDPGFVYRVYEAGSVLDDEYVRLKNGPIFPVPPWELDPGMKSLTFCVCSIGGRLEEEARASLSEGDTLRSLFLDAAGVAFLEALSTRAHETLEMQAQKRLLRPGCRFGPGYGGLELSYQKQLFDLVDASLIGVRLNESCVMSPAKSLSFVTTWTSSPLPPRNRYKCASCALTDCPYRLDFL